MVRDKKIRTVLRTNQIVHVGFVTVPTWKKVMILISSYITSIHLRSEFTFLLYQEIIKVNE